MALEDSREDTARYSEFCITLRAEPDRKGLTPRRQYSTVAVGSDGREVSGLFINPLEPGEVDAALSSIAAAGKPWQRSLPTDSLDPVRDLGTRLHDALFQGSIERAFAGTLDAWGEARVRLNLSDEEAMAIPWEFLYDRRRGDFLVLSTRTPLVRSWDHVSRRPAPPLEAPVRVLVVASDVTGHWQVDDEISILRNALDDPGRVNLTVHKAVTFQMFYRAFMETMPDVVHLIASGVETQQTAATHLWGQAVAFLTDTGLTDTGTSVTQGGSYELHGADSLGKLAQPNPRLRLVVLNGCRTDGVAASLARDVPGVIGLRGDITQRAALSFADGLYSALMRGLPLDSAVTAGRLRVDSRAPGGREWCAPVLYQQSASIAFPPSSSMHTPGTPATLQNTVAPRQDATASRDDRTLQKLNSQLAIHQANLDALERTQRPGDASYIEKEIVTTKSEIKRLSEEIAAAGNAPALSPRSHDARDDGSGGE